MKAVVALFTLSLLLCGAWPAGPAEAVTSPSPLDCAIVGSSCVPLSGVGQLQFSSPSNGTLIVTYDAPDGFKIVGGDQFGLNFGSAITGTLSVSLSINGGTPLTTTETLGPEQVAGCTACFSFMLGSSFIPPSTATGSVYVFTITGDSDLSLASVVAGGPLGLDAMLHLNKGGGADGRDSVFAAERGETPVPEPGSLALLATGFGSLAIWARSRSRTFFAK